MATYISTDWHGRYDIWEQVRDFMKPDDRLIYLGDAVDRGSRGWDLLLDLILDDRVTFIKGNHEDLFETYFTVKSKAKKKQALNDWRINGGDETLNNIFQNGYDLTSEVVLSMVTVLQHLPTSVTYTNASGQTLICTHAGFTPGDKWNNLNSNERYWESIWDRKHITDNWPQDFKYNNTFIVHGHTPCEFFKLHGYPVSGHDPISYCQDHKINLDMSTVYSNQTCLFDADTFQVYIFTSKGDNT